MPNKVPNHGSLHVGLGDYYEVKAANDERLRLFRALQGPTKLSEATGGAVWVPGIGWVHPADKERANEARRMLRDHPDNSKAIYGEEWEEADRWDRVLGTDSYRRG